MARMILWLNIKIKSHEEIDLFSKKIGGGGHVENKKTCVVPRPFATL